MGTHKTHRLVPNTESLLKLSIQIHLKENYIKAKNINRNSKCISFTPYIYLVNTYVEMLILDKSNANKVNLNKKRAGNGRSSRSMCTKSEIYRQIAKVLENEQKAKSLVHQKE